MSFYESAYGVYSRDRKEAIAIKTLKRLIWFLILLAVAYGIWWFIDEQHRSDKARFRYETYNITQAPPIEKESFSFSDIADGNTASRPKGNELLFLLAGVDEDGARAGTRTDTLMLCRLLFAEKKIQLLSIPRDSYVYLRGQGDKINHAHSYDGISLTLAALREAMGIDLDYYLKLDMDAVIELVDINDGVRIDVQEPQAGEFGLETGEQTLDGVQAFRYMQYRKGFSDGDLGRVNAQQSVLNQILPQLMSLSNAKHLPTLLWTMNRYTDTNLIHWKNFDVPIRTLLMGKPTIESLTLPGYATTIDGISYYVLDAEGVQEIVDTYLSEYRIAPVDVPSAE